MFTGNARTILIAEPLYTIATNPVYYFLPIYMQASGLNSASMGSLNSLRTFLALAFLLFGSLVVNRLGRRRSMLVLDLLGWAAALLVWHISRSFWMFALAYALNSLYHVQIIAFNCITTEDSPPSNRSQIFSAIFLVRMFGGVSITIFSLWATGYGYAEAVRSLCLWAGLAFIPFVLIRHRFLHETRVGMVLMKESKERTAYQALKHLAITSGALLKRQSIWLFIIINTSVMFVSSFVFFTVLFVKDVLQYGSMVTWTPVITIGGGLLSFLLIIPRQNRKPDTRNLAFALMQMILGFVMILISPRFGVWFYILYALVFASANLLVMTYSQSILMNHSAESEKADVNAIVMLFSTLLGIPSGILGGVLYESNPSLLFFAAIAVSLMALIAALQLHRTTKLSSAAGTSAETFLAPPVTSIKNCT